MKIFTLGYGGIDPSMFVGVLKDHSIRSIVDVRIWPIRANMGAFVKARSPERGIQNLLARDGIAYFSLLELGNPYIELPDWKERYRRLIEASGDMLFERLADIPEPFCLLCAEKRPGECHRSILAEFLQRRGHEVEHLIAPPNPSHGRKRSPQASQMTPPR